MGYTHYWRQSRPFTDKEWDQIVKQTKSIFAKAKKTIDLAGPLGDEEPIIDEFQISFNGSAEKGEDYETFCLTKVPRRNFAFCKTQYRPYDPVVVSVLFVAAQVAPQAIEISSDGGDIFKNEFI